jgi:tetratricopeptide (TPR) repeat protein
MAEKPNILIEGDLAEHPVPRLLNYIYDQGETGRLVLVQEGVNKTIHIIRGVAANVESSMRDETLGRFLVKQGTITDEDYEKSVEVMMSEGIQQGAALVKLGLLAPKELFKAVKEQSIYKLLTAFSFASGSYRFYSEVGFIEKITRFELKFHHSLKQGVYQFLPEDILNRELLSVERGPVVPFSNFGERFPLFEPEEDEKDFVKLIDGAKNISDLATLDEIYPFARKLLYLILLCGLAGPDGKLAHAIRLVTPGEDKEARQDEIMVSADSPEVDLESEEGPEITMKKSPDNILEFYIQLKSKNYFELLDLDPDADDEQVEEAYRAKLEEFSRDHFPARMDAEPEARLEEINAEIIKAYESLRSSTRRASYLAGLRTKEEKNQSSGYLRAEQCLQQGIKFVRTRDFANAQKMFEKAVELSPTEPEYYGYLGWTIFCNMEIGPEERARLAKQKLRQAIKMNPNMDSTHVFLGKILQQEGNEEAALSEFRLALKANANCREALRELESRGLKE